MASWHHWRQKQNSFFLGPQSQALVSVSESQKSGPQTHKFGVFALESFIHNLSIREEVYPKP
jgi:hypothetical protein